MKTDLPRVLVVSTNAWRDNTGINTLIEFFKCWHADKLAQIYTKAALPKTCVCSRFFRISENTVIKSVLKPWIVAGGRVENEERVLSHEEDAIAEEKRLYAHAGKKFSTLLSLCRELVWLLGRWKSGELDDFAADFAPDVLFIPIYPTIYMGRLQKYIIEKTGKPVVSYIADDNYSFRSVGKNPAMLLHRLILRRYVRYIITHSAKVMVISPKQKEEYDRIFGIDSVIMTKGIDFENVVYEPRMPGHPIKMVYTGKLIIGRDKALAAIAEAMGRINADETKVELDIYTTDALTEDQQKMLNRNGCQVKGALALDEVHAVQKQADILVFVESLEKKYRHTARLSFSTKITDYLKSGKCIFAVGDQDIAPIDYFRRYESAVTSTSYQEIGEKLQELVHDLSKIEAYGRKAYTCGKTRHDRQRMDQLLRETLQLAAGRQ